MSQLLTESKWAAVKDKLVEGLSGNRKTVMESVLDNQRKVMLRESATAGATSAGNIATLNKVILPIILVLCQPLLLTKSSVFNL